MTTVREDKEVYIKDSLSRGGPQKGLLKAFINRRKGGEDEWGTPIQKDRPGRKGRLLGDGSLQRAGRGEASKRTRGSLQGGGSESTAWRENPRLQGESPQRSLKGSKG